MKNSHKYLGHSKVVRSSISDYNSGFGYVIIPDDRDRSIYLKGVYDTLECMLVSVKDNAVIREVRVPKEIIQELEFPLNSDSRGSLVSWTRAEDMEKVFVDAIHFKAGESYIYGEHVYVTKRLSNNGRVDFVTDLNQLSHLIAVRGDGGMLSLKAVGGTHQCNISLKSDGTVKIDSDSIIEINAEEEYVLTVGDEKNHQQIKVVKDKIYLGAEAKEPAVLGDTLAELMAELIDDIGALGTITTSAGVTATINTSPQWATLTKKWGERLEDFKSEIIKIQ